MVGDKNDLPPIFLEKINMISSSLNNYLFSKKEFVILHF